MAEYKTPTQEYNLFSELESWLDAFKKPIRIAGSGDNDLKDGTLTAKKNTGYLFNQYDTLDTIDLFYNSKFHSGVNDAEGYRKFFLNICAFRTDVATKQTQLDSKDAVFLPKEGNVWEAYFITKDFREWAHEQQFGQVIDELNEDYARYGSCVSKVVDGDLERVVLKHLVVPQDCRELATAKYVIELHPDMPLYKMRQMKAWDCTGLQGKPTDKFLVYELYTAVPRSYLQKQKGETVTPDSYNEMVEVMVICTRDKRGKENRHSQPSGAILFIEETKKRPYDEAHWQRQDGRWLGIGNVESQFENQIARNHLVNMRRKGLLWASKKIFQSTDDQVANNLLREVKDGDVLKIAPNGGITPVVNETRAIGEISNDEQVWEENSNQKAFTFEVATGESLPSGTSFHLGVVLSNAVMSHYNKKKQNFGRFISRLLEGHVIPTFIKQSDEKTIAIHANEEGFAELIATYAEAATNEYIKSEYLSGRIPDMNKLQQEIMSQLGKVKQLVVKLRKWVYTDAQYKFQLVTSSDEVNVERQVESLTTLFQVIGPNPAILDDPRIHRILDRIMQLTGVNLSSVIGVTGGGMPSMTTPQQGAAAGRLGDSGKARGSMAALANQNAPSGGSGNA